MKYQEFEGGLKDLFHNAEATVDVDALIGGLHAAKAPRKSNRWLLFSLFCLLAVAGVIGLNQIISNNHQAAGQHSTVQYTKGNSITTGITAGQETKNTKTVSAALSAEEVIETKTAIETSATAKATTVATTKTEAIEKATATANGIAANTTSDANSTTRIEKSARSTSPTATTKQSNSAPLQGQLQYGASSKQADKNIKEKISPTPTNMTASVAANSTSLNASLRSRSAIAAVNYLAPAYDLLSSTSDMPSPQRVECPTFKKGLEWHFDLIPEVGFIVPLKTLASNSAEPSESFVMREADETPLEGLQAGLYGRIRPGNAPYYFKLGVSYTRLSERMNLDVSYTRSDTTIGIISITESQNGDTLTVIRGEIITDTMYRRQSVDHYFLHMIDIPAAIGYSKSIGGGWRIGGEVGAQLNIGLSTKGKLLESADSYTDLPASGRFLPNVGLSFFAGVTFEKAISDRGAIFVSPRFRYFPKAFTPDAYGIRQEYQFAGLHAGYIHSF